MRQIRRSMAFLGLTGVLSCGTEPKLISPNEIGVEAVYPLSGCALLGTPTTPCYMFVSGSTTVVADSGRLVLRKDRTATLVLAQTWSRRDNCTSGSPCPVVSKGIITLGGSYSFRRDSMFVTPTTFENTTNPSYTLVETEFPSRFTGTIPDGVPETWTGPTSLALLLGQDRTVVFKHP